MLRVLPPTFYPASSGFSRPDAGETAARRVPTFEPVWQQIRLQGLFFEGGSAIQFSRCATMLPKKLHVRFLLPVFPYRKDYLTFTSSQLES